MAKKLDCQYCISENTGVDCSFSDPLRYFSSTTTKQPSTSPFCCLISSHAAYRVPNDTKEREVIVDYESTTILM